MSTIRPVGLAYPKGTYKVVPFYWRGDDPLKEQEALLQEYRHTLKDFRKKEAELRETKQEFEQCQEELNSYDRYAIQIANDLGENSASTPQNAQLRKELAEVQEEIKKVEKQINFYKFWTAPIELTKLTTEDSALWPEIETQMQSLDQSSENINSLKLNISKSIITEQYLYSSNAITETRVALHCKHWLSSKLQTLRNSMNQSKSCKNGVRLTAAKSLIHTNPEINEIDDVYSSIKLQLEEVKLTKELASYHRKQSIQSYFQTVLELNDTLSMLGEETVDIQEIRSNCDIDSIESEDRSTILRTDRSSALYSSEGKRSGRITPKSTLTPKIKKKRSNII